MNRLTERFNNGQSAVMGCGENCKYDYKYCRNHYEECPEINKIYERLAEYGDTGLTPPQIMELKERDTAKSQDYEGDGYDDAGNIIYDTWICPNCGEKYEVDYDDFNDDRIDDYWPDWEGDTVICDECGAEFVIGNVEVD